MTALDTNILSALWDTGDALNHTAQKHLETALIAGGLVISGPVYGELVAAPGRDEAIVNRFIDETSITVDWLIDEKIWREAARAYHHYAKMRRKMQGSQRRRILTDFIIGAHALIRGHRLLTLDKKIYHNAFPTLKVITI